MAVFVLVHSPLTGPATWRWVAAELTAQGNEVYLPAVGAVSRWQEFADAVAGQVPVEGAVLVGHSGAGLLLPQIAARVPAAGLVFVDSDVPPEEGHADLMPAAYLEPLRALAVDGMLPRWSEWFGPDAMRELIPDESKRAAVTAELPQLPLSYFETRVPVPPEWTKVRSGYVLLSEAYEESAAAAATRGWPVKRLMGAHLDLVTRSAAVAAAISLVAGS
jgi:hypothetical protein